MHYRQGSIHRHYVSDIDIFLKTLHNAVCQSPSCDAETKEAERKQYEEGVFPLRDNALAPHTRVKIWQDE
jgi:hypothetical protein